MQDFVTFFQLQSVKISRPLRFGKADYDAISRSTTVRTRNEEIDIILPFPSSQYQPFPFLLPVGLQLSEPLTTGFRMLTNFRRAKAGVGKDAYGRGESLLLHPLEGPCRLLVPAFQFLVLLLPCFVKRLIVPPWGRWHTLRRIAFNPVGVLQSMLRQ